MSEEMTKYMRFAYLEKRLSLSLARSVQERAESAAASEADSAAHETTRSDASNTNAHPREAMMENEALRSIPSSSSSSSGEKRNSVQGKGREGIAAYSSGIACEGGRWAMGDWGAEGVVSYWRW